MSDQEPLVEPSSEDVGGAEACRRLNHEDLLLRVRRMNKETEQTTVPLHDAPVSLVLRQMLTEKRAVTWSRLCEAGGRPAIGKHIKHTIRASVTNPRRAWTWEGECPRSRYRGTFKPPIFDDEPSDSSEDEAAAGR